MPRANLLPIVVGYVRIRVSVYCNLHCAHCYLPENCEINAGSLSSHRSSAEEMTTITCRYCPRKASATGGERPFSIVIRLVIAAAHANKLGLQVQPNPEWLVPIPIASVASVIDDRERRTFPFSFDRTEEAVDRFDRGPGVFAVVFRQMIGAVSGLASVQVRMSCNRHHISEAEHVSAVLINWTALFGIKLMCATRAHTKQPRCVFAALLSLQPTMPCARCSCNRRARDQRRLAALGTSPESTGLWQDLPINITCYAGQSHIALAYAA